ncbi:Gcd10p family-domain-containing protein [Corynascus novoguineensis]|uniref:tRNA (adenine(58)-N(1))-methyltransferase non-catalytic subunit TRM6 n=1 Tax=Corynascus novoguineensis TaxID=1126955 RepID=A0AAN7CPK4_9PEZI|nr:Gcd10p family-domain-containing protein [Corynascus novoguineensis]
MDPDCYRLAAGVYRTSICTTTKLPSLRQGLTYLSLLVPVHAKAQSFVGGDLSRQAPYGLPAQDFAAAFSSPISDATFPIRGYNTSLLASADHTKTDGTCSAVLPDDCIRQLQVNSVASKVGRAGGCQNLALPDSCAGHLNGNTGTAFEITPIGSSAVADRRSMFFAAGFEPVRKGNKSSLAAAQRHVWPVLLAWTHFDEAGEAQDSAGWLSCAKTTESKEVTGGGRRLGAENVLSIAGWLFLIWVITISLGKYGSFPSNLIIGRPYHLTFEVLDKASDENFSRLRVVPTSELYAEVFAEESAPECATPAAGANDTVISATDGEEFRLVDDDGNVVARSNHEVIDENARQTLTQEEIEELKREGANAGKDVIAKLLLSHTAIDQKTSFSLAKYKLLKTKKHIRRFQVLPIDVATFAQWQLEERDASKIMDLRAEMIGLVGCWGNVHFGGEDVMLPDPKAATDAGDEARVAVDENLLRGRWLVVDDTCGLLVAAMAERMGVLYESEETSTEKAENEAMTEKPPATITGRSQETQPSPAIPETRQEDADTEMMDASTVPAKKQSDGIRKQQKPRPSDFAIPYSQTNTITVIHSTSQPNLSLLNYWGFDITSPNHPPHPLLNHLLNLTWLQLLKPELDTSYSTPPLTATPETLASWKPSRRGNFHRKRRRYARIRHIVDSTRAGNFSGLVCASSMDPVSILRHTLPLLAGGAPVAIYSPSVEPLAALADCFSVPRRTAWVSGSVPEIEGLSNEELEHWQGNDRFPLNPTLLQGVSIQTSRARRWQVLPGRTHPLMTERGGAEGYVFTAWRAKPAEGKVAAKGKFKRRKVDSETATPAPA